MVCNICGDKPVFLLLKFAFFPAFLFFSEAGSNMVAFRAKVDGTWQPKFQRRLRYRATGLRPSGLPNLPFSLVVTFFSFVLHFSPCFPFFLFFSIFSPFSFLPSLFVLFFHMFPIIVLHVLPFSAFSDVFWSKAMGGTSHKASATRYGRRFLHISRHF